MRNQEQFNKIFEYHYPKVIRLCKGYFNGDAEMAADASQEVFIKIWENLDQFRNESGISTWIFRITVNTCLVYLRKKTSKKEVNTASFPTVATESYDLEIEEKLKQLYACIRQLDQTGKMIILMVLEGMAYNEIADVVGITEETLRVRIHRIKKSLTQCVQK